MIFSQSYLRFVQSTNFDVYTITDTEDELVMEATSPYGNISYQKHFCENLKVNIHTIHIVFPQKNYLFRLAKEKGDAVEVGNIPLIGRDVVLEFFNEELNRVVVLEKVVRCYGNKAVYPEKQFKGTELLREKKEEMGCFVAIFDKVRTTLYGVNSHV